MLNSAVSLVWSPKHAQQGSFAVLGSKRFSTVQFRCFGVQTQHSVNLGQQDISALVSKGEKGGFAVFGSKRCSTVQFPCFGVRTQHSGYLGQQDISALVSGGEKGDFDLLGPKGAQQCSFTVLGSEHSILHIWDSKTFRPLFHLFLRLWGLYLAISSVWSENDPLGSFHTEV